MTAALLVAATAGFGAGCSSSDDESSEIEAPAAGDPAPVDGVFLDPQGTYTIEVDPAWQANHGTLAAEIEVWYVDDPVGGFGPNVNVLTQSAPGMDNESYLELSIENSPMFFDDFELIEQRIVEGAGGQSLAMLEYTGAGLQYLGVFSVDDGEAIIATLTAPPERFDALRDDVMPYLLTLEHAD